MRAGLVMFAFAGLGGSVAWASGDPPAVEAPRTVVDSIEQLVKKSDALLGPKATKSLPAPAVEPRDAATGPSIASPAVALLEANEAGRDLADRLPACTGGVLPAFKGEAIDPPLPGSNAYQSPDKETMAAIGSAFQALLSGDGPLAAEYASIAGYELCSGREDENGLVLFRPAVTGLGAALIAWRADAARPLIVEAPHPFYDEGTLEQALAVFASLKARALIASGTHRCASQTPSLCDGFTTACDGTPRPYRESDMAHNNHSVFQLAHEILADHFRDHWVLSLHGMAADGAIVSDGTLVPTVGSSLVARFTAALGAALPEESIRPCNPTVGVEPTEHLCGTTNTQGRWLNGIQEDSCLRAAVYSADRFVHLEQSRRVRDKTDRLIVALERVLASADDDR